MPETSEYRALLGAYATQYAGVPGFKKTVATLRDLNIQEDLEVIDRFNELLENYRRICQELHSLKDKTLDPEFEAVPQLERSQSAELRQEFPRFEGALQSIQHKFATAFTDFQANAKYLTENRRAASDMFNWIKGANNGASSKLAEFGGGVDPVLDRIRHNAGILDPIRR